MKQRGRLDTWVHTIGVNVHGDGWPEAAGRAIQAAANAGVLTQEQANSYFAELRVLPK
jgi:hypothetical protein